VPGNGNATGDPVLNGYDRKAVTTINDSGVGSNNDTLIINYNDVSPNSIGDYTGGVIINGTKAIMFEDGSIIQSGSVPKLGNFKKEVEANSGRHRTVGPDYADAFMYIDNEDDPRVTGNSKGYYVTGASHNNGHSYSLPKMYLPDDEKCDKLYASYYSTIALSKSGKAYSMGRGYSSSVVAPYTTVNDHQDNAFHRWTRAFCDSDNCKITKVILCSDNANHESFAIDEQGYLWGHGVNDYGILANGTGTPGTNYSGRSGQETLTQVNSTSIVGKREALANTETSTAGVPYNLLANRVRLPHIMNPMLDSSNAITTNVASAQSLLKITDAVVVGSYDGGSHPVTIAAIGEDKRVYVAGYGDLGQAGDGTGTLSNKHWVTVQKNAGVPLTGITKLYGGGQDSNTFYVAIDENHEVWAWGRGAGGQFGTGTADHLYAKKIFGTDINRRASYVITNNAGSGDTDAFILIVCEQDGSGASIDKEIFNVRTTGFLTGSTHPMFNTSLYSIQDIYYSNGETSNYAFVIARNKSTNKLEMYAWGDNTYGQLGVVNPTTTGNNSFAATSPTVSNAHKVPLPSNLIEKVVNIRMNHTTGRATYIHLSDGRIFVAGYVSWGLWDGYSGAGYVYYFTPIKMLG
jgi:alpha-tubulin suppressor-like RCC1 family protein